MNNNNVVLNSVDEYIASFPEEVQKNLEEIRAPIIAAAPEAEEKNKLSNADLLFEGQFNPLYGL